MPPSAFKALAAAAPPPARRHTTSAEINFLRALHEVYGTDTAKMARDTRVNRLQKTKGEIERSLMKAGGWEGVALELGEEW